MVQTWSPREVRRRSVMVGMEEDEGGEVSMSEASWCFKRGWRSVRLGVWNIAVERSVMSKSLSQPSVVRRARM